MLGNAVQNFTLAVVMTDPNVDDNPITYVNQAFLNTTQFTREFVIGRNCRFLQGPETEPEQVQKIREGLAAGGEFEVTITNHKADGTPFRNHVIVSPVFGDDGELAAYFGLQRDVTSRRGNASDTVDLLRELQHRVKNHLGMVVSMIRTQARREVTPDSLRAVGRRIESLALLYEELFSAGIERGEVARSLSSGHYLARIASVVGGLESRPEIRVDSKVDDVELPLDTAARLGLLLSELLTNSLQHAFEGRDEGRVQVRFEELEDGKVRLTVADDGIGLRDGANWPAGAPSVERQTSRAERSGGKLDTTGDAGHSGVGGTIVRALTQSLGAEVDVQSGPDGTTVSVEMRVGE
ncbi:MAG: PAS domain-containing protein [Pseudooceanicola sp.]